MRRSSVRLRRWEILISTCEQDSTCVKNLELLEPQNPPGVIREAANDILNCVLKFRENETLSFELYEED